MEVMKPIVRTDIPVGDEWLFEIKYDGFRCMLDWEINHIKLTSKNNRDLTNQFPEIVAFCLERQSDLEQQLPLRLDGELCILNTAYQANFKEMQWRGRLQHTDKIRESGKRRPATLMVFDVLQMNDTDLKTKSLAERNTRLLEVMGSVGRMQENRIRMVDTFDMSDKLWKLIFDYKAEGLVAKCKASTYQSGKGHHDWFKVKNWRRIYGILYAYNAVNGYFSVGVFENNQLHSIGKCKHGLDDKSLHTLKQIFLTKGNRQGDTYLLPPAIVAVIHTLDLYDGELREPEFDHLAVQTPAEDCTLKGLKQHVAMFPQEVELTNPDKLFWPEPGMTKRDLLIYIREAAPYMLPFMNKRALTLIRCPDGVDGGHFFQKHLPDYAPEFISYVSAAEDEKKMLCDNLESLVWFANNGAIEYHLPFQNVYQAAPVEIVFDLDPPSRERFDYAIDAALLIKKILDDLELISFIKTSGNKGLQIHIPIPDSSLSYEETALFTQSVAWTVEGIEPEKFTTERFKNKRGERLYIDYVQHGKNKTIIVPYSPRKTADATVATPLYWKEVTRGLRPEPFTIDHVLKRVHKNGCPFAGYFEAREKQQLHRVKKLIRGSG